MLDKSAKWLKAQLDYEFDDSALLQQALTHRSAANLNNERLEFLGDAVLDLVVSDIVYRRRPEADEGELSRLRASLVRESTLAEIANELDFGQHLILGSGEKRAADISERRFSPMRWRRCLAPFTSIAALPRRRG